MDERTRDRLRKQLPKFLLDYEKKIEETDEHYDELAAYSRYSTAAPYGLKYLILFLIQSLEEAGVKCEGFREEYERITGKLAALEQKRGSDYREKLFSDLKHHVGCYPDLIDGFAELEPLLYEILQDLAIRSSIEILLMELERDYDLTDMKREVSLLDKAFKSKYMQKIEEVIECCPEAEDPYSPNCFWWDHPFNLLKEKQAMERIS